MPVIRIAIFLCVSHYAKFIYEYREYPASKRSAGGGMNPLQYDIFL